MDRFVGLDLSLNGTGVAILEPSDDRWVPPRFTTIRLSAKGKVTRTYEAARLVTVINRLYEFGALDPSVKLAAIEDYAYGVDNDKTNCTFSLGELGGCARYHLYVARVPYINAPIQTNKKFATGNGSAKKDLVARGMAKLWGLPTFTEKEFDSSDALALATLAAFKYYGELPSLPNYRFWAPIVANLEVVRNEG